MPDLDLSAALLGGAMIGAAAVLFFRLNGRIAGISGLFGDIVLDRGRGNSAWRVAFIVGVVLGSAIVRALHPVAAQVNLQTAWPGMIGAGLLVGFGTRMACGCTSGHGICGIARLSPRSLVATAVFMLVAMLTVALLRHGGWAA